MTDWRALAPLAADQESANVFDLKNKTILVTGASRGIGAALARQVVAAGGRVIPHATGMSDAAAKVAREVGADFVFEDLSSAGAGDRVFAAALEAAVGQIDGVVNNAGIFEASPLSGGGWDEGWTRTLAVNVQAPADICRAAVAHFRASAGGTIVNIASRAGHRGDGPDHGAYAASKGALLAMTKTWARALAGEGIHLYAIAPGWVETRMAPEDIKKRADAIKDIPLGRVAQPDEVAAMAVFLLTGACASAVGATMDINGASYVR
ncbi:MAG: SDR family oxidoreductase [Pseudomonadota bacterium]